MIGNVHSPNVRDKYVFMDQGGELYSNPDIVNVFTKHQYEVYPTGTDSSHQNGLVEQAQSVIGDHVRALLIGANLDIKFWPHAFFHHLCIQNTMAMNSQSTLPIIQATGEKENFQISVRLAVAPGSVLLQNVLLNSSTILSRVSFLVLFLVQNEIYFGTTVILVTLVVLIMSRLMKE